MLTPTIPSPGLGDVADRLDPTWSLSDDVDEDEAERQFAQIMTDDDINSLEAGDDLTIDKSAVAGDDPASVSDFITENSPGRIVPGWLSWAGPLVVLTIVLGVLSYVFGQLFNINL